MRFVSKKSCAVCLAAVLAVGGTWNVLRAEQTPASAVKSDKTFHVGGELTLPEKDAIPVAKVLKDQKAFTGKQIRVNGKVGAVCESKGCWLTVTDGENKDVVFLKFADPAEGRLVPLEAVGKEVTVEGTFVVGTVSEKFAKHIRECQGATEDELAKISGPQKQITFKNPAVVITGVAAPTTQPVIH